MTEPDEAVPRGTIHIVEDDESQRRAIGRFIEASGYRVKTYDSAEAFLAAATSDSPRCVILDLRLPGPSGLDLQEILAARPEPLPVIFLSGYGAVPDSVRAMKSGAVDFLTKPVDGEVLLNAIGHALARDAENRSARSRRSALQERYERLTSREREVFAHLISGQLTNKWDTTWASPSAPSSSIVTRCSRRWRRTRSPNWCASPPTWRLRRSGGSDSPKDLSQKAEVLL